MSPSARAAGPPPPARNGWARGARPACGGAGEDECPKRFVAVVSQHDNDFAQAIAQIVGPMHGAVPGLRVTVWKVSRGGVEEPGAITLHGRSGGRLVGVVYYL